MTADFPAGGGNFAAFSAGVQATKRFSVHFLRVPAGIGTATDRDIVTGLTRRLSALVLVVAIVATAGGSAFAQHRHPTCETEQHDCGQLAKISRCCCGDLGTPGNTGTPAEARTDVTTGVTATPLPPHCQHPVAATGAAVVTHTSPPRLALLDLTTLFACLLI